jgi:hypothetical protein
MGDIVPVCPRLQVLEFLPRHDPRGDAESILSCHIAVEPFDIGFTPRRCIHGDNEPGCGVHRVAAHELRPGGEGLPTAMGENGFWPIGIVPAQQRAHLATGPGGHD